MCGITGIVLRDGAVNQDELDRMTDSLAHRGPDGRGTWINGSVGLGHRLLRIVGECPQPVTMGDCTLTYNGEIYGIPGSLSDTARLIPLYWKHGFPWMLRELNGMFAFCIYDQQTGELYLARDRFGEKPLYYAKTQEGFYFASEIKALLDFVPAQVNEDALGHYSTFGFCLRDETLFKGIKRLEPGHALVFRPDTWTLVKLRYWHLPYESETVKPGDLDDLRDLIVDAVKIRTRADVAWGTYLSGGLDSSLVTCLARPALAFNGDFDEPGYSEFDYASMAARKASTFLMSGRMSAENLADVLDEVIWHLDEPVAGVGALPQYLVAGMASEKVTVVLSGQGGDELFAGYGRYADCADIPRPVGYENYTQPLHYRDLTLDSAQRFDVTNSLQALLHVEDRVNMAHGIESRAPFLDHRIAEFVFSRPASWRVKDGKLKGLLREVARGIVPDPIIDREDKQGFPTPFLQWFGQDWQGTQRELWQSMSLETWNRLYIEERMAA